MNSISTNSSIRHAMYRRELLRYIQSMTIVFHPFAEIMERVAAQHKCTVVDYRENPYYRNLAGEYSCLDINQETGELEKMEVYSVEENRMVPFDKQLWVDYPQTASLYYMGSEAYSRLCLTYPDKVGLIKNIIYPVKSVDAAHDADELTILRHEPSFLRSNEQESLYTEARRALAYIRDRWYVYDYGHEDQYYLVFMAQVYYNLFQALLTKRINNQDTHAVHHMHVWDRLEANGLGPYESVLNDVQARWFYRNMNYLKENRGRKSNLILLADNILKNLKVHLVGKRIFQQTYDPTQECIEVPEFLSEEIVDYSLQIAESLPADNTTQQVALLSDTGGSSAGVAATMSLTRGSTDSMLELVDTNSVESMDYILSRVYGEGYYPKYSVDNSAEKEYQFGRTVSNTVPTRLLEFQKYTVHAPYERHMAAFLYDSLQLHAANHRLAYNVNFVDPNTNVIVDLTAEDALALVHYVIYKRFGIEATYLPVQCYPSMAYKPVVPRPADLPKFFHWNKFKYRLDTFVDVDRVVSDITWSNNRTFTTAASFMQLLGEQYQAFVTHIRQVYLNQHTTYNWAMAYLYRFLLERRILPLRAQQLYSEWITITPGVKDLIDAYEDLPDKGEHYNTLCDLLLEKLLPIDQSEYLISCAGALFDDTKYYTQLKNLFQEWTSHDLTYLDTDRSKVTFISGLPQPAATYRHIDVTKTEVTTFFEKVRTHLEEELPTDLTEDNFSPNLVQTVQEDQDSLMILVSDSEKDIIDAPLNETMHTTIRTGNLVYSFEGQAETMNSYIPVDAINREGKPQSLFASDLIELSEGE